MEDYKELNLILDRLSDYFEHLYKTKNLKNIIFIMGAFCWYKKRIDYIKYLWEYKQPPDSDTTWLGPAILPDTIGQLIEYYFNTDFEEKLRLFRDDRHGIRIYFDEFFILFLLRYSVLSYSSNNNVRSHLGSYILQDFKSHILSDIINSVPKLIDVNNGLIEKKNIILELGFKEEEIQRTLTKTIPDFLNKIKGQAEKQLGDKEKITKISGKRIEEFKREFLEEYKSRENESFIEILSHFKNFKDKSNESDYPKNIERKGLNNIIDKAAFFEDWHINYAGFGSEFGRNMASGKDFRTFVDIFERCTVVSDYGGLDRILSEISDIHKSYILLINFSDYRFKEKYAGYIPKWHTEIPSKIDISGFEGIYKFGSYNIPVFGFYFRGLGKNIVVLNSAKLGELIQYNPSKENDEENTREDIFYFNVRVYSDNPDLVDAIIKKPPPWLKEIGDESKQREYLESKALLHVFERYEFKIAPVFEGYKIKIPEERDLL
ncbi:MAG: hypothetical protein JSU85_11565 [Candidatus Zixiibacteriota bacterium]|nr:MAG: hypothetical protein JSU85_11565 [candidate division Zixibacteria bacterium]